MTAPLLVLTALETEAGGLRARLSGALDGRAHGVRVTRGRLAGRPLLLAVPGVGKVAAATTTALLGSAADDRPVAVLSVGVAGGLGTPPGALVVVEGAVEHDYDLRPFVGEPAVGLGGPRSWAADEALVRALSAADPQAVRGWAASGDQVVASAARRDAVARLAPDAVCVEMETAAVAHAAGALGLPWAGLRVVSDDADEALDPEEVLARSARASARLADVLEVVAAGL